MEEYTEILSPEADEFIPASSTGRLPTILEESTSATINNAAPSTMRWMNPSWLLLMEMAGMSSQKCTGQHDFILARLKY
jgi:hypothetical protein